MKRFLFILFLLPLFAWSQGTVIQQSPVQSSGPNFNKQVYQWSNGSFVNTFSIPGGTSATFNNATPRINAVFVQWADSTFRAWNGSNWVSIGGGGSSSNLYLNALQLKNNGSTPSLPVSLQTDTISTGRIYNLGIVPGTLALRKDTNQYLPRYLSGNTTVNAGTNLLTITGSNANPSFPTLTVTNTSSSNGPAETVNGQLTVNGQIVTNQSFYTPTIILNVAPSPQPNIYLTHIDTLLAIERPGRNAMIEMRDSAIYTSLGGTLKSRFLTTADIPGGGYAPSTRTLTINGTTQDLSANRTWSVGTVTSITAGTHLTGGTITTSGTIGTDATTSATPSTILSRDANGNSLSNINYVNTTSTVSSGGTSILTAASSQYQALTGSSSQTYQLPVATTMLTGPVFLFNNNSSGSLIITNNGGTTLYTVPGGGAVYANLNDNSTSNGTWDFHPKAPSTVTWGSGVTGLVFNTALTNTPSISAGISSAANPSFIPQRGSSTTGYGGDATHLYGSISGTAAFTATSSLFTIPSGLTVSGLTTNNGILYTNGSGVVSQSTSLPNGTTATTQAAGDNSTKVATTAYVAGFITSANFVTAETPSGSINSSNTSYTLANTPVSGTVKIYRNGLRQIVGTDYTISGASVTYLYAPSTGDSLIADYQK